MQQTSVDFIDVPYEEMLDEIRRSGLVHTSWNPAEDSTKSMAKEREPLRTNYDVNVYKY